MHQKKLLFINPPFGNYMQFFNLKHTMCILGSYTLNARQGLVKNTVKTLRYSKRYGGWVNQIGLCNPGIDYAIARYNNTSFASRNITSIALTENTDDGIKREIHSLVQKIPKKMNIELNVSCPNVGRNTKKAYGFLNQFLDKERKWCIIKLPPAIKYSTIDYYYNLGFRQFHISNTMQTDEGGLSGPRLIRDNVNTIDYITRTYRNITVIGGGGITDNYTMSRYELADHISISSIFLHPYKGLKFVKSWEDRHA